MNATERTALVQGLEFFDEMSAAVDELTLEILERRRRTAVIRRRGWLVRRMLLVADLIGLVAAMALSEWLVSRHHDVGVLSAGTEIVVFLVSLPAWVVVAKLYGLYDRDEERTDHSTADDFLGVFHMVTVCTFVFWACSYITRIASPAPSKLIIFWVTAVAFVSASRAASRALARRSVSYLQNTVIVGAGDVGRLIATKLLRHPEYGINLVGFVDSHPEARHGEREGLSLLGGIDRLPSLIRFLDIERVIVAFSNGSRDEIVGLIPTLKDLDVQIDIVPRLFEFVGPGVGIHTIEGIPLVGLRPPRLARSSRFLKRTMDVLTSLLALAVLAPLFVAVAALVKLDSSGPVLFRQVRVGAGNQTFRILKFRSMLVDADTRKGDVAHLNKHLDGVGDARMFKILDDPRMTRVGRTLRRTSIDELPQLINVLLGQMSLVGPRPLILEEHAHVHDWAERRLDLRPGMTGLWQVLGRHDISFAEMVRLDYLYVTGWTLGGDVRLLFRTLPALFRKGA